MDKLLILSAHPINDPRIIKLSENCKELFKEVQYLRFNISLNNNNSNFYKGIKYIEMNLHETNKIFQYSTYFFAGSQMSSVRKRLNEDYFDIIHVHDPQSLIVGSLLKKRMNSKLVYDRHEKWNEPYFPKHIRLIERIFSSKVDGLVCVTNEMAESLPDYFPKIPSVVVPNWPTEKMIKFKTVVSKIMNVDKAEVLKIIYFGYLNNERTMDMFPLFRMLAESNIKVDIKIGGQGPCSKEAKVLASSFPSSIKYLGPIPYEEAIRFTMEAHIGVMFTNIEKNTKTSNNKLNEYFICGTLPIVKINEDDYNPSWPIQLMNECETTDIFLYIMNLWKDRTKMREKMHQILSFGRKRTWEVNSIKYENLYKILLSNEKE